jgi:hypothetical protein
MEVAMNIWMVLAIAAGLLVIAGLVAANVSVAQQPEKISCSSCGGKCTADKNCGLASCGAVSGGSCGCGK